MDGDMELLLVQTMWRHGDRAPTLTYVTDPIKEDFWKSGGGGWGQLSPKGMMQHLNFGKQLRKYYVDTKFLSSKYSSKEIYVRSSDVNRTIISAISNLMGMYGQNDGSSVPGLDYPDVEGWPKGYVPIAVHTVDHDTDHTLVPHVPCNRQDQLWQMAKDSDEVRSFLNTTKIYVRSSDVNRTIISAISNLMGMYGQNDESSVPGLDYPDVEGWPKGYVPIAVHTVDHDTDHTLVPHVPCNRQDQLWQMAKDSDEVRSFLNTTKRNVAEDELRKKNSWYSDKLLAEMTEINNQIQLYNNGIFEKPVIMNNLDIGLELKKIRGGSMYNDILMHMNIKLDCLNNRHKPQCNWIKDLKYYIYSGHDTSIFAFLSVMEIGSKVVVSGGYPDYTAAVFIELWRDTKNGEPYFKLLYRTSDVNDTIFPITQEIPECGGKLYCKMEVFRTYAAKTKPDQLMDEVC
ncbi:histidine acid phosphatase [Oesophagostomum dentatum]|uniref:Histidine acid phosphatase n=1 Tax=Oesophagostomum dentatum TaxID=61180 RepID=A0A0B1T0I9_OESDE|nr:histidine acid phosphatase [Oesophagostomum dentatum]